MEEKDPQSQKTEKLESDVLHQGEEPTGTESQDEMLAADQEIGDEILGTDADYTEPPSPETAVDAAVASLGVEDSVSQESELSEKVTDSVPGAAESQPDPSAEAIAARQEPSSPVSREEHVAAAGDRPEQATQNLNRILDMDLPVTVHFGSVRRPLVEILKLGPGSLLELDRLATEPVVLKVNDKIFARGQVVDIDGYYGVKITEIVSPEERITSLGEYQ